MSPLRQVFSVGQSPVNAGTFQKILTRNILFPFLMTIALSGIFVALLYSVLGSNRSLTDSARLLAGENEALQLIIDSETGLRGFLLTGKEPFLSPRSRADSILPAKFSELAREFRDSPAQIAALEHARSAYREWNENAERAIESRRIRNHPNANGAELRKDLMDQVRVHFDTLRADTTRQRDERTARVAERTRFSLFVTLFLSLALGGALALVGRRNLLSLADRYEEALEAQLSQNAELERQAWLRAGQTRLGELIRGELSVSEIADRVVGFCAEYVGAEIGALFLVGDGGALDRVGGYALPENTAARIAAGQGIVGQAAQNASVRVISPLPEAYLRLNSATGEGRPQAIALVPLTADGAVRGVVELGFLGNPTDAEIEFLRHIAELVGTALRSAVFRTRLQDLLHESQQLSEELQTQQEELRVSNEELSERTEALQTSAARLESQQAELEQTNEQLEEQAQLLEAQRRDLDERNAALERSREEMTEKAEMLAEASRYKSEFLANMSHELRTPLNSSLILAKLLRDNGSGNLTEEQVHFAATIYDAGNDLLNLINDILDLSKVEAGKLDLNIEVVPPRDVLQGMDRFFRPVANAKNLGFDLKIDDELPSLSTDRQRLDQILRNLLSNAMKFTMKGSVSLEVRRDGSKHVIFAVRDTGIGIDPDDQVRIFDAFHQADGTINRKYGGTGLGLSISRSLAHLLGGTIEVESRKGDGAVFSLRLPIEYPSAVSPAPPFATGAPIATPSPKASSRKRDVPYSAPRFESFPSLPDDRDALPEGEKRRILLVVEDEPEFAKILHGVGREADFKVLLANTTTEGYSLAVRYLPTAIILDMKLPDASGLSLLDRLKGNPATRHIPVHGISADDFSREALHLGAVGFLRKPAEREDLKRILETLEQKTTQTLKRVLIVEDDARQREAIEKLIGDPKVELIAVGTGADGIAALAKSTFDCMIMDVRLPDMSGFQLLETLAADRDGAFPPVIVYTGHDLSRDEEDRLRRYSRSIIIKGARSPERLLDEVTLFLHQVESKLSPEHQRMLRVSRNREKAFEGRTVLLADDDVRNIFALTSALEQKGAKVLVARNGREAVEKIEAAADTIGAADLVLMDIMMPEMDGYEAMRRIRADGRFADLPIIAVTAKAMRQDYDLCISAGANDYLAKPIDLDRLISLMRVWLPRQIGRR